MPSDASSDVGEWLKSDIAKVIRMCRRAGVPILMHGYPSGGLRGVLAGTAAEHGVPFIDHMPVFQALAHPEEYFAPDRHCNALGYGLMAKDLQPKVIELLGAGRP